MRDQKDNPKKNESLSFSQASWSLVTDERIDNGAICDMVPFLSSGYETSKLTS